MSHLLNLLQIDHSKQLYTLQTHLIMDKQVHNKIFGFLLLFASWLSAIPLYAERVGIQTAQTVATNLAAQMQKNNAGGMRSGSSATISLVYTAQAITQGGLKSTSGEADFYAFNVGTKQGFVIVSGEDRVYPIIGYAPEGEFKTDQMPDNIKAWLQHYQEEINYAITNNLPATDKIQQQWQNYTNGTTKAGSITPVVSLETANWNQYEPYNNMCPIKQGQHTLTGCVATAQAIVMKYHQYPAKALGGVSTYYNIPITYDAYNWENMLPEYGYTSNESQNEAVAKLMFHCGANVEMNYSLDGSGAVSTLSAQSLVTNFGYDKQTRHIRKERYPWNEWKTMINKELDNNRPVIYDGQSRSAGHAFVCDGYTTEGAYHINWGWGGYVNGYFLLSTLDSEGDGNGYSNDQAMIIGIQPDAGSDYSYALRLYSSISCEETTIQPNKSFRFYASLVNEGSADFNGVLKIALVDANYKVREYINEAESIEAPLIKKSYRPTIVSPSCTVTLQPNPTDKIVAFYSKDGNNWEILKGGADMAWEMSVTAGVIQPGEDDPNEPEAPLNISMYTNGFDDIYISTGKKNSAYMGFTSSDLSEKVCFRYKLKDPTWQSKVTMQYGNSSETINSTFNFGSDGVAWMDAGGHEVLDDQIKNHVTLESTDAGTMEYEIAIYDQTKTTQYAKFDCSALIVNPVKIAISEIKGVKNTDIPFTLAVTDLGGFSGRQVKVELYSYYLTEKNATIKYINGNTPEAIVLSKPYPEYDYVKGEHLLPSLTKTTYNYTFQSTDLLSQAWLGINLIDASTNQSIPHSSGTYITISDTLLTPCNITYQLKNITATPQAATVQKGQPLTFTLTAATTYQLPDSISISMSGKTLTADTDYTYDTTTGKVTITAVTGDVSITAEGASGSNPTEITFISGALTYKTLDNSTVAVTGITDATKTEYTIPSTVMHNNKNYTVTKIGEDAFVKATGLLSIDIPSSVITIEKAAFAACEKLQSVTLHEGLKTIGREAFSGCASLQSIDIPASVTQIEEGAIEDCLQLSEITVKEGNQQYTSVDGVLFNNIKNKLLAYPNGHGATYTIPSNVTCIGRGAFAGCEALTDITIPEGVRVIEQEAFKWCSGLTSITIPESIVVLNIIDVRYDFPSVFEGCDETLQEIHWKSPTPIDLGEYGQHVFFYYSDDIQTGHSTCKLFVPKGSKTAYEQADGWKYFKNILEEDEETEVVVPFTLNGVTYEVADTSTVHITGITDNTKAEYTIPSTVTNKGKTYTVTAIGYEAFKESKLTSIILPESLITIGEDAFKYCRELARIEIPSKVETIEDGAFLCCSKLEAVTLKEGLNAIKESAFTECSSLTSIEIPASVTLIDDGAFDSCIQLAQITVKSGNQQYASKEGVLFDKKITALHTYPNMKGTSYEIPQGVKHINTYAFMACSNLTEIIIPEGVETMGEVIFDGCTGLKSITLPVSLKSFGKGLIDHCDKTLLEVHCKNATPINLGEFPEYAFFYYSNKSEICKLFVPKGSKAAYQKAAGWNIFKEIIEEGEDEDNSNKPLTPPSPESDITISEDSTYTDADGNKDKFNGTIGSGEKETVINTLVLNGSISTTTTIVFNHVTVGDGSSAQASTSVTSNTNVVIELIGDNSLGKLVNDGIARLTSASNATLHNTTVVNNGVFTDETAFITQVEGPAGLNITAPTDHEVTEGSSVTLTASTKVGAPHSITFIWEQLQTNGTWKQIAAHSPVRSSLRATEVTVKDELPITPEETSQYRCIIKNEVGNVSTTLTTAPATVTVNPTDVGNATIYSDNKVYVHDGVLYFQLTTPTEAQIIHFNGTVMRNLRLPAGETRVDGLTEGFYIIRYKDNKTVKVTI